ncbi:MAG: hypothetical protein ABSG53_26375, partial [Thermoguttaceae bacterium]
MLITLHRDTFVLNPGIYRGPRQRPRWPDAIDQDRLTQESSECAGLHGLHELSPADFNRADAESQFAGNLAVRFALEQKVEH